MSNLVAHDAWKMAVKIDRCTVLECPGSSRNWDDGGGKDIGKEVINCTRHTQPLL